MWLGLVLIGFLVGILVLSTGGGGRSHLSGLINQCFGISTGRGSIHVLIHGLSISSGGGLWSLPNWPNTLQSW